MSEFEHGLNERIDQTRAQLAVARDEGDDYLVEVLLGDLESLVELAGDNDVATGEMKQILAAETGTIPVIEEPERGSANAD
ncbi:hypothetical protein [Spelaeicoccus albus]|uniref:Uncharacterized protein n=1 Tax=Spelaeicoccus albus TaxID=1280376 RepID=A0A7Z0D3F3_9MICO|nr:hypothetical protein [Spelaeicoccus albus]NYI68159.1 hypothetical protein [Spelaeicoccus albus]